MIRKFYREYDIRKEIVMRVIKIKLNHYSIKRLININICFLSILISIAIIIYPPYIGANDELPYFIGGIDRNGNYTLKSTQFYAGDTIKSYNEYPIFFTRRSMPPNVKGAIAVSFENIKPYLMKASGGTIWVNLAEGAKADLFLYSCNRSKIYSFEIQEGNKFLMQDRKSITREGFNRVLKKYNNGFMEISYPIGHVGSHTHLVEIHSNGKADEIIIGAFYFNFVDSVANSIGKQIIDNIFGKNIRNAKALYDDIKSEINDNDLFQKILKKSTSEFRKYCVGNESSTAKLFCDGVSDYFISYNVAKLAAPYMCGK